jgi:hypothetical protein
MSPSSTLLAFGTLVLGAAVAVAQPVTSTAGPVSASRDCSGELARQSIARMQRQAQPEALLGSNCLAARKAIPLETAQQPAPVDIASAGVASAD